MRVWEGGSVDRHVCPFEERDAARRNRRNADGVNVALEL